MKKFSLLLKEKKFLDITMIHMELGPSTILGLSLTLIGFLFYFVKTQKHSLSRDYDLFFSSVGLLCGGILIFQGWRLDPILLLCQIFSSATAIFFIGESLWLRNTKSKNKNLLENKNFSPGFLSNQIDKKIFFSDKPEEDLLSFKKRRIQKNTSNNSQTYLNKSKRQSYQEKKIVKIDHEKTKSFVFKYTDPIDYAYLRVPNKDY